MVVEEHQIDKFRQLLLMRQQKLTDLVRPSVLSAQGRNKKSPVDQQAQLEWSQINKALARIEAGTYGDCVVCGKMIESCRLKAYPHSPFCRSCVSP